MLDKCCRGGPDIGSTDKCSNDISEKPKPNFIKLFMSVIYERSK
jgi:hypothetical protein